MTSILTNDFVKTSLTDVDLITKNNQTLCYSKWNLCKHSMMFKKHFETFSGSEILVPYDDFIVRIALLYMEGKKPNLFLDSDKINELIELAHVWEYKELENACYESMLSDPDRKMVEKLLDLHHPKVRTIVMRLINRSNDDLKQDEKTIDGIVFQSAVHSNRQIKKILVDIKKDISDVVEKYDKSLSKQVKTSLAGQNSILEKIQKRIQEDNYSGSFQNLRVDSIPQTLLETTTTSLFHVESFADMMKSKKRKL